LAITGTARFGFDVLKKLQQSSRTGPIPVVVSFT